MADFRKAKTKLLDLTGKQFGRLKVLKRMSAIGIPHPLWLCRCNCGEERLVRGYDLRCGKSQSCGCLRQELHSNTPPGLKHGEAKWIDGKQLMTKEYRTWHGMKSRCRYSATKDYHHYGGKGIRVCKRWLGKHGYENFLKDMGRAPSPMHSIDRKNSNENYTPSNCRWATSKEQRANQRKRKGYL